MNFLLTFAENKTYVMKRIFLCAILMLAAVAGAIKASAEFRYGPTAGVAVSDLNFKQDICTVDKSVGYSAGITGELMFPGIGFGIDRIIMLLTDSPTIRDVLLFPTMKPLD